MLCRAAVGTLKLGMFGCLMQLVTAAVGTL